MGDGTTLSMGIQEGYEIGGRYEVFDLIGRGGFAAVFRARDDRIGRDVAVKVLDIDRLVAQGNDKEVMLARFQREARLAARISHPSVVQIHDFGIIEDGEQPYIVMEILKGRDLDVELKRCGPMEPQRVLPHFVELLEALGEAHELGIIHRDLKPSNLFVVEPEARRERIKLVDFGIAHLGDGADNRLTKTGYMVGTPQYMSPEYLEDQRVTPAMDVYQMGLIMVECLAGRPVIDEGNPWKCAMLHVSEERELPVALMESPLGPVIDGALAIDPDDRFGDAGIFAEALAAVAVNEVPTLEGEAKWGPWTLSQGQIKVIDGEAKEVFEQAHASQQPPASQSEPTREGQPPQVVASEEGRAAGEPTVPDGAPTVEGRPPEIATEQDRAQVEPTNGGPSKEPVLTPKLAAAPAQSSSGDAPSKERLAVVALLLVLLLGGGWVWLNMGDEEPQAAADAAAVVDSGEPEPAQEVPPEPGEALAMEEEDEDAEEHDEGPEEEESFPTTVVDSGQASAAIYVDDELIGEGRGEWEWEGDEPVLLRVEASGYEPYERELEPGVERVDDLALVEEEVPEPEPSEPTPAPAPPEPQEEPSEEQAPVEEETPADEEAPADESEDEDEDADWLIAP